MTRIWAFAVLALASSFALAQTDNGRSQPGDKPAADKKDKDKKKGDKEKDFEFRGKFADNDPLDAQRQGPSQTHVIKMKAGNTYTIDMVSTDLDSYLRLLDPKGMQLDEDDDSGGNLNSRIMFNCPRDGDYKVVCTTFAAGMTGSYGLTVKSSANNFKPTTALEQLVGKEAPDFKGDFAVNGKAVKLSDLKGKAVLLYFWEVRSTASADTLPTLAEWNKTHKGDGLAIVGVTHYISDIGQRLAFDKDSGKLTQLKEADRLTDQKLIANYAGYHKIDHLLLALAHDDAIKAFDAYNVNSLPQFVLIDRKGVIRSMHVGAFKNASDFENEIKSILAEK